MRVDGVTPWYHGERSVQESEGGFIYRLFTGPRSYMYKTGHRLQCRKGNLLEVKLRLDFPVTL